MISIQVRPHLGSNINDVFAKSCALAAMLGVAVEFEFNDYECSAYPNGNGWLFWKCKAGQESSVAGHYRNGEIYLGGSRPKPLDTPPSATP